MNRNKTDEIITEYLKPIYGFALKHCRKPEDAEDLTQEICLKLYRSLLSRDDILDISKYAWTVAHNALANYYRDMQVGTIGISLYELEEFLPSDENFTNDIIMAETTAKLHSEIAYLSKLQRKIVIAYYYENKKQTVIAKEFGIPLGTVKWHLFEAKKELKEGMDIMRQSSELKFNPIKFSICGFSGSTGTKGGATNFFRSALSQNIAYSVMKDSKTINEIASELGVSPVYVESEAEYLEEYGFLSKNGDKYIINFLLDEANEKIISLMDDMYEKAAKIFANELYCDLLESNILKDKSLIFTESWQSDTNFILWALIPYISALSGEEMMDKSIAFEQAYTIRPDGGKNICYASVENSNKQPKYFDSMLKFCGPCWNGLTDKFIVWTIDSEWSEKRVSENYQHLMARNLSILEKYIKGNNLSDMEYAYLSQIGYIKKLTNKKETELSVIRIPNKEAQKRLLSIGDRIKTKHRDEFNKLKTPYIKAMLDVTAKHLYKMRMYGLQYTFYSDGWFILYCLKELVNNGKLKLPTEEQKKSLTTLIAPNI